MRSTSSGGDTLSRRLLRRNRERPDGSNAHVESKRGERTLFKTLFIEYTLRYVILGRRPIDVSRFTRRLEFMTELDRSDKRGHPLCWIDE